MMGAWHHATLSTCLCRSHVPGDEANAPQLQERAGERGLCWGAAGVSAGNVAVRGEEGREGWWGAPAGLKTKKGRMTSIWASKC